MRTRRAVFPLVTLLVLLIPGAADAEVVDRIVEPVSFGTASGAPTTVSDSQGNLHVVYSRNSTTETRADLYYRMISFDDSSTPWGVTVGAEACSTAGYGGNSSSNPLDWTSLHMAPQAEIDSSDRIHVVFRGFGRFRTGSDPFFPYHTGTAYLNFPAPTRGYTDAEVQNSVLVARLVDNDFDADLDPPHLVGAEDPGWDQLFRRMHPTMSLREVLAESRVEIHVAFASTTGDDPTNGWERGDSLRDQFSYLRLVVDPDGHVVTDANGFAGSQAMRKHTIGEDRSLTDFIPVLTWRPFALPSGHAMVVGGDILNGQDQGYAVLVNPDDAVLDRMDLSATNLEYGFAAALDSDAQVHVASMFRDEHVLWEEDPSGTPWISHTALPASYSEQRFSAGASEVFADGMLQALIAPNTGGAPMLARPDYSYLVSTHTVHMFNADLSVMPNGGPMLAVYATGNDTDWVVRNVVGSSPANNLYVTVFHRPEPATDVVAWIAHPEDGDYIQSGRVTLSANDGAPGAEETYTWQEGSKVLGTGASTTVRFKRGVHTIDLVVARNGVEVTDRVTFYFGVQPPAPPEAGITVFPTSGLQTTEAGGTDSFTVVLDTEPTAPVTIDLAASDTTEGIASPSQLVFEASNWDTPRTVTVAGQDDATVDGDVAFTIVLDPASSLDTAYQQLDPDDVAVTNQDDDGTAVTYDSTDVPKAIPDLGQGQVSSVLSVGDSLTVASLEITLSATHERPSDLTVVLISPSGTREIVSGTSGTFTTTSFTGESGTGIWRLEVTDEKKKKTGTLVAWSIQIGGT